MKDVFFEAVVAMLNVADPALSQRVASEHLTGLYGVGGLGFDLADFLEYVGSEERFVEITRSNQHVIESVCGNDTCTKNLSKLFRWVWFLLVGGRLPGDNDRSALLHDLPEEP